VKIKELNSPLLPRWGIRRRGKERRVNGVISIKSFS
jgi:hypothetical protein